MKRNFKVMHTTLFWLLLALAPAIAFAQQGVVSTDFRVYLWASDSLRVQDVNDAKNPSMADGSAAPTFVDVELYYKEGANYRKLSADIGRLSSVYKYRGDRLIAFYQKGGLAADGTQLWTEVGSYQIPEKADNLVLFLFNAGVSKYNVLGVEGSTDKLPAGSLLLYNLSAQPLHCSTGGAGFDLPAFNSVSSRITLDDEGYQRILVASQSKSGQWRRRIVRRIPVGALDRQLFVIYADEQRPERLSLIPISL